MDLMRAARLWTITVGLAMIAMTLPTAADAADCNHKCAESLAAEVKECMVGTMSVPCSGGQPITCPKCDVDLPARPQKCEDAPAVPMKCCLNKAIQYNCTPYVCQNQACQRAQSVCATFTTVQGSCLECTPPAGGNPPQCPGDPRDDPPPGGG